VYSRAQLKIQIVKALEDIILQSIPSKLLSPLDESVISPVIGS